MSQVLLWINSWLVDAGLKPPKEFIKTGSLYLIPFITRLYLLKKSVICLKIWKKKTKIDVVHSNNILNIVTVFLTETTGHGMP